MVNVASTELNERVRAYHRRTAHHLDHYALGPGRLDWSTEPDPFRRYTGVPHVDLPLVADSLTARWADVVTGHRPGPLPLSVTTLAAVLELSLGLSAWKQVNRTRWPLRCNPSSGNLHPIEAYVVTPSMGGLSSGVYHYEPDQHRLTQRATGCVLPVTGGFLVGLSSITWREAWKYGERAFRYCEMDAGHAVAAVSLAAATVGWHAALLADPSDDDVAEMLGIDREDAFAGLDIADRERPVACVWLGPADAPRPDVAAIVRALSAATWAGAANALSPHHVHYRPIDDVTAASIKPATLAPPPRRLPVLPPLVSDSRASAAMLIRQRRSAVDFDGTTRVDAGALFALLERMLPRHGVPPLDALPLPVRVHPVFFIHRVDGIPPGTYLLLRDDDVEARLTGALSPDFSLARVDGCPAHVGFRLLVSSDARDAARIVSCHQEIAADGVLAGGCLADFDAALQQDGPHAYRALHWEAGMLVHILYLWAEEFGIRATGIGCYFDEAFHGLLGLRDETWHSVYHFSAGGPVEDSRLSTLPPYAHLDR